MMRTRIMRVGVSRSKAVLGMIGVAAVILSACAKSTPTTSGGSGPSAQPGGMTAAQLQTSNVSGLGSLLDNGQGLTLYHLTSEKGATLHCTSSTCVSLWHPLLLGPNGELPALPAGASGSVGKVDRPDGTVQVTVNGMPLYTFSGDSSAGQANGQGIPGEGIPGTWFAVSSSGASASGSASSGSSSSSGGYHY